MPVATRINGRLKLLEQALLFFGEIFRRFYINPAIEVSGATAANLLHALAT